MTISSTTRRWEFTGDGSTTVFAYTNKIFADGDLAVYVAGTLQTLDTHYTVSGEGVEAGGNVTFTTAPADGSSVIIVLSLTNNQAQDLPAGGALPASSIEDMNDRRTLISLKQQEELDRALKIPVTDTTSAQHYDAGDKKIESLAQGVADSDAVTKAQMEAAVTAAAAGVTASTIPLNTDSLATLQAIAIASFTGGETRYMKGRATVGDGAEGTFIWRTGDKSTEVAADEVTSGQGDGYLWIAPASDKTGASGAWEMLNQFAMRAESNAVPRTVRSALRERISIFDWLSEAEREDVIDGTGSIDLTTKFDNALSDIYTSGTKAAELSFPQGTYKGHLKIAGLTNNSLGEKGLAINGYGAILKAVAANSSIIRVSGAVAGTPIVPPIETYANGLHIAGFTLDMSGMANDASSYAIATQLSYNCTYDDIHVINEPALGGGMFIGNQCYTHTVRNLNCARVRCEGFNNSTNQSSTLSFWAPVINQFKAKNCFDITLFAPIIQGSQNHIVLDDVDTVLVAGGDLEGTGGFCYEFLNSVRNVTSIGNTPGGYTHTTYATGTAYNSNLADRPPFGGQGVGTYGRVNGSGLVALTSTAATAIFNFRDTANFTGGGLVAVRGDDGSNGFMDLLLCSYSAVAVVSSNTMYGSPPTRTYALASNELTLARSANTAGNIHCGVVEILTSN